MSTSVSVVIPSLGRATLTAALDSVREQAVDVEIIVVDDSGRRAVDGSAARGVRVIHTAGRIGAAAARNAGMQAATGTYIAFLDDDDRWLPGHLRDALDILDSRPDKDIYASRGLVLDEEGRGRVEPAVLVGPRTVADYFFEPRAWRSRSRRILTPTLVFRATLADHLMDASRTVNEDTWWLLTAERDRGARLVQSPHIGVVVHGSGERTSSRWSDELGGWLDDVEALRPGAAAVEQLSMLGRPAVREGRPEEVLAVARDVVARPGGWRWSGVLGLFAAAASASAVAGHRTGSSADPSR